MTRILYAAKPDVSEVAREKRSPSIYLCSPRPAQGTFNYDIYHGINGRSLGASKEFPVDIYVNDVETFSDVEFGQSLTGTLPPGDYNIKVYSDDLGVFVDSMEVQADGVPADVDVFFHAKFSAGKTPILQVRVK